MEPMLKKILKKYEYVHGLKIPIEWTFLDMDECFKWYGWNLEAREFKGEDMPKFHFWNSMPNYMEMRRQINIMGTFWCRLSQP